ncbi:endo-1,4-beta-xylanase [Candidatus Hydrogenedentota bacterium]
MKRQVLSTLFWGTVVLSVLTVSCTSAQREARTMPEQVEGWALDGAEERIREHRMGEIVLELVDSEGNALRAGIDVSIEQTKHAFYFGGSMTSMRGEAFSGEFSGKVLKGFEDIFNYATMPFYWSWYESKEGKIVHKSSIQGLLDWAEAREMTTKGHPIIWHQCVPEWLEDKGESEVNELIRARVGEVIALYPEIDHWDVINEAPAAWAPQNQSAVGKWVTRSGGAGPATEILLDIANRQDPGGFYLTNCFTVLDKHEEQLEYLVDSGARFNAVGVQSHMHSGEWTEEKTWDVCERFSKFGKPLHFTETTVISGEPKPYSEIKKNEELRRGPDRHNIPPWESTPEGEARQAQFVADFYTLLFSHPAVEAIIWWNICDRNAWRAAPGGFLDANGDPKPSYTRLHNLIKNKWWTKLETGTRSEGKVNMFGFYGAYRVRVNHKGRAIKGDFTLEKSTDAPGVLRINLR